MSDGPESSSKVLPINTENVFSILDSNELVVIIFYTQYDSKYSKFESIVNEAAMKVFELYSDPGKVVFGKSCCSEKWIYSGGYKFYVHDLYIKVFIHGKLSTVYFNNLDYMSVQEFVSYVQNRLDGSIQEISSTCSIPDNPKVAHAKAITGYFKNKYSSAYRIFRKVSMNLMDICRFYAGFGEKYSTMYSGNQNESLIIFKISDQPSPEFEQEIFSGDSSDYESLYAWGTKSCLQSTSEITFDNAMELDIDQNISLILFYNPDDLKPVRQFKDIIKTDLEEWRDRFKFFTADGQTFSLKLQQIGKTITDLPFVILNSFNTIYFFPENINFTTHHELKKCIQNYYLP
ncbi:endoplasmic reticulum resident protein 44-like isoform X2 [Acyrthosiphon pisum]|nr:endoplasmic reticulum resident protein 44-like isoform X2 [Acyrthosiphon pisum]|eukprot:XP_016656180.1 PREDICTED: endoplasmic reticulum resident protein 44-like isoform X2 [Acyrthosiphon pisum]